MQYMVTGHDGKEYGPTDLETLKQWVAENRLAPHTKLRDFMSGQVLNASEVPGLFAAVTPPGVPPMGATYPRTAPTPYSNTKGDHGGDILGGVIFRCVIALALAFVLGGIGLITGAYAMYYAVQCQRSGSKYGIAALIISGVTLAIIGIWWAYRLSTHQYGRQY